MHTDHRKLEVASMIANDWLKMALVHYQRTQSGEATKAAEAAKADWRTRMKADPNLRPSNGFEHAVSEAVEMEAAHRVARREFDVEMDRQRQERAARLGAVAI